MADMKFDIVALDRASSTFVRMAEQVDRLAQRIDKLDRAKANPKVEVDTKDAEREVGSFATEMRRKLEAAARSLPEIEIDANSTPAQRKLAELRARMQELADKKIGVDIDATSAIAQAQALQRELDRLGRTSKDVQLRADTAAASAQLAAISGQVDRLDGRKATVKVDVDRSLTDTINSVARLGGSLRTLALPASLVAAAPQVASLGAAMVATAGAALLLPAALAAAGGAGAALGVGLSGVGDTFKALAADELTAATSATSGAGKHQAAAAQIRSAVQGVDDARRQANRSSVDGDRSVEDARRRAVRTEVDGAQSIEDARRAVSDAVRTSNERVASAESQLERAQESRADAVRDLNRAVLDAREANEDLKLSLSGAALSEESAVLGLERARERLAKLPPDRTALDYKEAELAVRQAAQAVDEAKERHVDLALESAHSAQVGVAGADSVQAAARRTVAGSREVREAEANLTKVRADGAREVAEARAREDRARESARQADEDAARAVSAAQESARRQGEDSARALQRAEEQLRQAYQTTGEESVKAASKSKVAYDKLAPAAKSFVDQVQALKPAWDAAKLDVQQKLFEGIGAATTKLADAQLPGVRDGLAGIAAGFNAGAREAADFLSQGRQVDDVRKILDSTGRTTGIFAGTLTPISGMFLDISAVGGPILEGLAGRFANSTDKAAAFVSKARETGDLAIWIQQGIDKLEQLGSIAGNTGGVLMSVFAAADRSGADFLGTVDDLTQRVDDFFNSAEGESALVQFFSQVGETIDNLEPGLEALGRHLVDAIGVVGPLLPPAAAGVSAVAEAAGPLVVAAAELARIVLGPLLSGFTAVAPILTPIAVGIGAIVVASKGFSAAQGYIAGWSGKLAEASTRAGDLTTKLSGSASAGDRVATAGGKVSSALGKVGNSLPLVGLGLVGIGFAYDAARSKADSFADSVLAGSMSIQQAVEGEKGQIETRNRFIEAGIRTVGALAGQQQLGALASDAYRRSQDAGADAARNVRDALLAQVNSTQGAQHASAEAALALADYNDAVTRFGAGSPEAIAAQGNLATATNRSKDAQRDAAAATRDASSALREQQDQLLGAANADIGYRQALLNRKQAQQDAAAATRDHGASSDEAQQANLRLEQADLQVVTAADRLSQANLTGASTTDQSRIAAFNHDNTLLGLASGINGTATPALISLASKTTDAQIQAHNAAVDTSGFHYEVRTLPDGRTVKIVTDSAVREAENAVTLKKKIEDLPLIRDMKVNVNGTYTLGDGTGGGGARNSAPGFVSGHADGGILPGYTPGRDVHSFSGPAGQLNLSGGEAILRPEATRALGSHWVHSTNRAARSGGVAGVRRQLGFAAGGIYPSSRFPQMVDDMNVDMSKAVAAQAAARTQAYMSGGGEALSWASSQVGKPYIWGGVGPAGYDCSGFISAIVNVMRGKNPFSRVGTTASFPWPGFQPGLGPGLSVGAFKGNPGHMAGTINGVNVESAGGVGVRVGGAARGAADKMFNIRAHLPGNAAGGVGAAGAGVQRWAGLVAQSLAMVGQSSNLVQTVLRRMQQESGGNPSAINNWDSNAKRGTPSKGLMQVIDPTFRANWDPRTPYDIWNPLSNVVAAHRYALRRYGSLPSAYNRAGGYANGGVIDRPTFGLVGEAGPEAIIPLSRPARAAEVMKQAGLTGGQNRSVTFTGPIHIHKTADVDEVVDRLNYLMAGT